MLARLLKAINIIFFLLFLVLASSCKSQKLPTDTLIISFEKTPCLGSCESFKFEIFSSGKSTFKGLSNHKMLGNFETYIAPGVLQMIIEQFREADFLNFKNQYTGNVTDLPTTYIYFKDQGTEKMVQDYYNAPQKLKGLEQLLDQTIVDLKWKRTKE